MGKKVLIDLLKLREMDVCQFELIDQQLLKGKTFKTIRELATFYYTCRKCEDAPCINACPAEALEKDNKGVVSRALNLCIRCKSCVVICPFGTMMNDLFNTKIANYKYFDLSDEEELRQFAEAYPNNTVCIVEENETFDDNVFELSDNVLIREYVWDNA